MERTPPKKPKLGEYSSSEFTEEDFVRIPGKFIMPITLESWHMVRTVKCLQRDLEFKTHKPNFSIPSMSGYCKFRTLLAMRPQQILKTINQTVNHAR